MRTLITGLFLLLCFAVSNAQSLGKQIDNAKFLIVKKTAEFLSTDKATFGNKVNTCSGCKTYEDVIKYANGNSLTKVDQLVTELKNIGIDTTSGKWEQSLAAFKKTIVTKITTGNANKEARTKMPGYQGYLSGMDILISNIKEPEQGSSAPEKEQPPVEKPAAGSATGSDTTNNSLSQTPKDGQQKDTSVESSLLDKITGWLPYIIAGILLIALVAVWRSNNENKGKAEKLKNSRIPLETELLFLKKENSEMQDKIRKLEEDVKNKEIDLQATEARLQTVEKSKNKLEQSVSEEPPLQDSLVSNVPVQKQKPVTSNIKYARYADLGDGFSSTELLDKVDSETIFELVIMPNSNTGEFKVVNHAAAQHYALSNAQYFLGKTCQYNSFPSEDATIQTDTPGSIKLTGSKWSIVSPAKISFS